MGTSALLLSQSIPVLMTPRSLFFQAADELYMDCLRSVDPEDLRKPCAKYVFRIVRDQNAVAGASAHVFRACKPEIKVRLPIFIICLFIRTFYYYYIIKSCFHLIFGIRSFSYYL